MNSEQKQSTQSDKDHRILMDSVLNQFTECHEKYIVMDNKLRHKRRHFTT